MTSLKRTTSTDPGFLTLVKQLDAELDDMYGSEMDFYNEFNTVDALKQVIIAYVNHAPAGCGAIKQLSAGQMEVKRIFVDPTYRGKGIAESMMLALETWARELGSAGMILETGDKQHAAMALYKKLGYKLIANYGQYSGAPSSVCYEIQF